MQSIGLGNDYHINLMSSSQFAGFIRNHFPDSEIYGQRLRGNWLYSALRAADVFNLRLRLVGARRRQQLQQSFGVAPPQVAATTESWVFTPRQLRQANNFVAVCKKP
jgi:hypothetical protein